MPAHQACLLMLHIADYINKWSTMVSKGGPQIHQKSLKIQFGTFQYPCVCNCDPLDWKIVPKCCPGTSKWIQNGHLGTLKGVKNQQNAVIRYIVNRIILFVFYPWIWILETSFSIPANSCSLQISSQLVARGPGGRGEALRYIWTTWPSINPVMGLHMQIMPLHPASNMSSMLFSTNSKTR